MCAPLVRRPQLQHRRKPVLECNSPSLLWPACDDYEVDLKPSKARPGAKEHRLGALPNDGRPGFCVLRTIWRRSALTGQPKIACSRRHGVSHRLKMKLRSVVVASDVSHDYEDDFLSCFTLSAIFNRSFVYN